VINYQLASAINPPASPLTNLRFHRLSDLRLCSESVPDLRRRQTLLRCWRSTPNFPGGCILWSLLQFSLRLAPIAAPPVFPLDQLPILRRTFDLSAHFPINLRLAPDIASSSFAFEPDSWLSPNAAPSSFPFGPTSNLRQISNPPVLPSNQLPTHHQISRL
jgi:hypothetical protein